MHPHVVISGIASLFADEDDKPSEAQMNNQEKVNVVDEKVTDDWESFKRRLSGTYHFYGDADTRVAQRKVPTAVSSVSLDSKNESSLTVSSVSSDGSRSRSPSPSKFLDRAVDFIASRADEPIARWVRKHRDEPVKAGKRWIIERFQFGICMFDPAGLRSRYAKLVGWQGGLWVNYWTQTKSKSKASPERKEAEAIDDNDEALLETGVVDPGTAKDLGVTETKDKQRADSPKKEKKLKPGRHFIVLPTGLGAILGGGENWERVLIEGVGDEVEAHCGLFIPGQNLDYQGLVERTSDRVLKWCETIQKRTE
ncbi:hypothetical protein ONZ45_g16387 [Pleurotus djamor]|nr:hypothetical protein ONZ45_g16387 [Pleurotus djamor]